jgi:hypothetical protein
MSEPTSVTSPAPTPSPAVGRIVHYVSHGSPVLEDGTQRYKAVCRAAVITEIPDGDPVNFLSLAVLNPTGVFFDQAVPYSHEEDGTCRAGSWHWPERV